jgi:outer membrane protein insertion porin family
MIVLTALTAAATLSAQAPSPVKRQPPPGILHSVTVKGNEVYSAADIVKECGLHPGERITAAAIEQARLKLQKTELFNNVADEYRFSGYPPAYDVVFTVTENKQVFPMRFERLGVSPDAIRQYLREHIDLYSDRIPGTEGVLARYKAAVQQFVSATKPDVKVLATISNDDPQQLAVLFAPDTPPPTISQVIISGNQAVDTGTILRAVNAVAVGTPLSDMRLKLILNGAIRPLYAAKGYAAVSFPKIETVPSPVDRGVIVKVQIADGPIFHFGAIHFHGSGLDPDEVKATIPFRPGQTFNGQKVDDFKVALLHDLHRRGYLDAAITTDVQPDDSTRTVNVAYNITPGAVYTFQSLDIQDLDVTSEPVIERLWGEKAGRPFNPEYPDFFLKRVMDMGIFDHLADTHSDYTADASTHGVIVHLYFVGGDSAADRARKKREQDERRETDGTWSPW